MATFWALLKESVITQSLITIGLVGVVIFLYAVGRVVPDTLFQLTTTVVAFWMGAKVQHASMASEALTRQEKRHND